MSGSRRLRRERALQVSEAKIRLPKDIRNELNRRHRVADEVRQHLGLPPEDHYCLLAALYGTKQQS